MTRIIAGSAGGRRLDTPPGAGTRPTSDRVREALFSRLEHLGAMLGADVLDLYAGSGALGLGTGLAGAVGVGAEPPAAGPGCAGLGPGRAGPGRGPGLAAALDAVCATGPARAQDRPLRQLARIARVMLLATDEAEFAQAHGLISEFSAVLRCPGSGAVDRHVDRMLAETRAQLAAVAALPDYALEVDDSAGGDHRHRAGPARRRAPVQPAHPHAAGRGGARRAHVGGHRAAGPGARAARLSRA